MAALSPLFGGALAYADSASQKVLLTADAYTTDSSGQRTYSVHFLNVDGNTMEIPLTADPEPTDQLVVKGDLIHGGEALLLSPDGAQIADLGKVEPAPVTAGWRKLDQGDYQFAIQSFTGKTVTRCNNVEPLGNLMHEVTSYQGQGKVLIVTSQGQSIGQVQAVQYEQVGTPHSGLGPCPQN